MSKRIGTSNVLDKNFKYIFNLPLYIVLGIVVIFPLVYVFSLSFFDWQLTTNRIVFNKIGNYFELFKDARFINAIWRNFYFAFFSVLLQIILGFGIALILNAKIKGVKIYRLLLMIPMMSSPIVVALTWRFMLNRSFGIVNHFLEKFGFQALSFLGDKSLVLPSIILVDTWQWTPYVIILLLAGLQSLPPEPLEAAQIDGANPFQRFFLITLPLMKTHLGSAVILRTVMAFKIFDIIWGMTRGGPAFASETLYPYIFSQSFLYFRIGYSCAAAVLFLLINLGLSLILNHFKADKQ